MTIAQQSRKATYSGNGATTSFPYAFEIPDAEYASVLVVDAEGNPSTPDATQYSISGIGSPLGGTVTYPLAGAPLPNDGSTITIIRTVDPVQTTSLRNQGGFYPDVLENSLDYLTMIAQQLDEVVSRALVFPIDEGVTFAIPPKAQRADMNFGFDTDGNPTLTVPGLVDPNTVTPLINASAAAASAALASTTVDGASLIGVKASLSGMIAQTLGRYIGGRTLNASDFGVVYDDPTHDNTAAIQAAFASGRKIEFRDSDMKITAPITLGASGGFEGHGENTIFRRFFNGGPIFNNTIGNVLVLGDWSIDCDPSITPVAGDDGLQMGLVNPWAGRGRTSGLTIQRQWNGVYAAGGPVAQLQGVSTFYNLNDGIRSLNGDFTILNCLSQFNGGWGINATNSAVDAGNLVIAGTTTTFLNYMGGLLAAAPNGMPAANLWIQQFCSSFDRGAGVSLVNQLQPKFEQLFVEGTGQASPTGNPIVFPVKLDAIGVSIVGTQKLLMVAPHVVTCQGSGMLIDSTDGCTILAPHVDANGQSGQSDLALRSGIVVQNGNKNLILGDVTRVSSADPTQLYDINIRTTDNTGLLHDIVVTNWLEVPQTTPGMRAANVIVNGFVPPVTLAASTLTLPIWFDFNKIHCAGGADINFITPSWAGRRCTLQFDGARTLHHATGNVLLANATDFVAAAFSQISLICDGAGWYQDGPAVMGLG